jgi:histidinol-phosphate aminotransferase
MKLCIPPYTLTITPYVPGKPIEALEREYGITDSIKLASNENPLGPSPKAMAAMTAALSGLHRYPEEPGYVLLHRLADHLNVDASQIIVGNGSDEVLGMLSTALLQPGDEVIVPTPSFLMYTIVAQTAGAVTVPVPLRGLELDLPAILSSVNAKTRIIFICNPNNPTGQIVTQEAFDAFLEALPENVLVVVDEAYIEFVRNPECLNGLACLDAKTPVVVLRTFSKAYGLAGLRVGYAVMSAELAEVINRVRMPFNVNTIAQVAATAALDDIGFLRKTLSLVHHSLDMFYGALSERGIGYFPSQSNFFLIDLARDAKQVYEDMLHQGVIVRPMSGYGYPQYIRINVGLPEENQRFIDALDDLLQ